MVRPVPPRVSSRAVSEERRPLVLYITPVAKFAIVTFPALSTTNLVAPDLEAVKMSPEPELSTTSPAREVEPEMEAMGVVPELPRMSSVLRGELVPIPTAPVL